MGTVNNDTASSHKYHLPLNRVQYFPHDIFSFAREGHLCIEHSYSTFPAFLYTMIVYMCMFYLSCLFRPKCSPLFVTQWCISFMKTLVISFSIIQHLPWSWEKIINDEMHYYLETNKRKFFNWQYGPVQLSFLIFFNRYWIFDFENT